MIKVALTSEYTAEQRKAMCRQLRAWRERERLTLVDLAEHLDDYAGNIQRVMSGNQRISLEVVMMLAHALGGDLVLVEEWQLPWTKLTRRELEALEEVARRYRRERLEATPPALQSALDKLEAKGEEA